MKARSFAASLSIAELVQRRVAVIASTGGTRTVLAAKAATATIPIVFEMGGDPVELGIVKSLNQPEGNITGIRFFSGALGTKKMELLSDLVPTASTIAHLGNPSNPTSMIEQTEVVAAVRTLGRDALAMHARNAAEIDNAFAVLAEKRGVAR